MQNGDGRESGGCVEPGFSKKTVRCNYPGEQMSSGGGGGDCHGCCFMTTWYKASSLVT